MKTITGAFLRPDGSPAANAKLLLKLSQDASSPNGQIEASQVTVQLDVNGNIPANTQVWANDELQPAGTFYHVVLADNTFGTTYKERLTISGNSPININTLVPTGTP